jgi:hypothetical protein
MMVEDAETVACGQESIPRQPAQARSTAKRLLIFAANAHPPMRVILNGVEGPAVAFVVRLSS